jgi:hypothetical protein
MYSNYTAGVFEQRLYKANTIIVKVKRAVY